MDEIVKTFLLGGDKVILEMHFRRPRFTVLVHHLLEAKNRGFTMYLSKQIR